LDDDFLTAKNLGWAVVPLPSVLGRRQWSFTSVRLGLSGRQQAYVSWTRQHVVMGQHDRVDHRQHVYGVSITQSFSLPVSSHHQRHGLSQ